MAADIKELAISYWRMEKWLNNTNVERKMAASSALRAIKRYLDSHRVEVLDLLGQHFDSGLAVDVINNDVPEGTDDSKVIVTEMIKPIIMQDGAVVQFGQVSIGVTVKKIAESLPKEKPDSNDNPNIKDMTLELVELSKLVKSQTNKKYRVMGLLLGIVLIIFMIINAMLIVLMSGEMKNEIKSISTASTLTEESSNIQQSQDNTNNEFEDTYGGITFTKYEIKSGDSLLSICNENGISYTENIEYIKNINGLDDINKIYVGQKILLPIDIEGEN